MVRLNYWRYRNAFDTGIRTQNKSKLQQSITFPSNPQQWQRYINNKHNRHISHDHQPADRLLDQATPERTCLHHISPTNLHDRRRLPLLLKDGQSAPSILVCATVPLTLRPTREFQTSKARHSGVRRGTLKSPMPLPQHPVARGRERLDNGSWAKQLARVDVPRSDS